MSDAVAHPHDERRQANDSSAERVVRRFIRPVLWVMVFLPVATISYAMFFTGLGANPGDEITRLTGRWAIRFLAASLAVTPIIRLTGWGWLIPQRRFLGVTAFAWACVHLLTYFGLDQLFDLSDIIEDIYKHLYIIVGMTTFLLLLALALTSTKASVKRMGGQKWQRLHRLVYVAAITATIHYLWAVKKDTFVPIVYFAVFATLLGARLVWRKKRGSRAARP